jgi:hypothetical protein
MYDYIDDDPNRYYSGERFTLPEGHQMTADADVVDAMQLVVKTMRQQGAECRVSVRMRRDSYHSKRLLVRIRPVGLLAGSRSYFQMELTDNGVWCTNYMPGWTLYNLRSQRKQALGNALKRAWYTLYPTAQPEYVDA